MNSHHQKQSRGEIRMIENMCHNCNQIYEFCDKVYGGINFYCNDYICKINESGVDSWVECSFVEFLDSIPRKVRGYSETPMADGIQETLRVMGIYVPERKRRKQKSKGV